jgi:hypothetical protein
LIPYPGHIIQRSSVDSLAVIAIKHALNQKGFGPLDETSTTFGAKTEATVKQFQKANQLIQDGEVGLLTWTRLFAPKIEIVPAGFTLRSKAVEIARTQLFVREKTGHNDGKEVLKFLQTVGLKEGFAWCMAFVYWSFLSAAEQLHLTNPVPKTGGVLDCLNRASGRGYKITDDPLPGDQGIMDFGAGHGHTFLVSELKGPTVFTVEGNTSADPSYKGEDREGNGVFERNRKVTSAIAYIRYY